MPEGDKKKKAEKLMKSYEAKKKAAAEQEALGKAQIKNNVKQGSMGSIAPYTKKWQMLASQFLSVNKDLILLKN